MINLELRAWNKYHKEMHSVYEINFYHRIAKTIDNKGGQTYTFGFKDLELMRKIDRRDHSGEPIFEGDIVRFDARPAFENRSLPVKNLVGKVAVGDCVSLGNWDIAYCHNIEVIGNIYENPDLLER